MKKTVSILLMFVAFLIIYFLQVNFFTWFNIAGVMPNLFILLIMVIGLFAGNMQAYLQELLQVCF